MDTGPGRGGLSPFYCCCGILLLFGKVVYLRHLICAHYSLVRAWLLNVRDVYVASSVVQALPLRRTWVNSLQSRRGQSALQQTDRNAEGCNLVFLPFLHGDSSNREKEGKCSTLCWWERNLQGSWWDKCTEKSKSQSDRGRKWRKRRKGEKALQPNSSCWECCCLFEFAFL